MSNLAPVSSLPNAQEFQTMKELGQMAIKSGLLPSGINTPEKAMIIILKGRELGVPPMQAFSSIAVINGKPTMSAELMLSLIYKNVHGAVVNYKVSDHNQCVIEAKRPGGEPATFAFTMEDAKRADLASKGPWRTYPAAMLRARCISAMARAMFPDALSGVVYTPEELNATVDDEGNVIEIPAGPDEVPSVIDENQNDPLYWVFPFQYPEGLKGRTLGDFSVDEIMQAGKSLATWKANDEAKKSKTPYPAEIAEPIRDALREMLKRPKAKAE